MLQFAKHSEVFHLDKRAIESYIIEPVWYKHYEDNPDIWCTKDNHTLNDIIFLTIHNSGLPVEVKGSDCSRDKAISQIEAGFEYITSLLNRDCVYGINAYYNDKRFDLCYFNIVNGKVEKIKKKLKFQNIRKRFW